LPLRPLLGPVSCAVVTVELKMYGSEVLMVSKTDSLTPKFWARMALGVCATQSSTMKVVPTASKSPGACETLRLRGMGGEVERESLTVVENDEGFVLIIETLDRVCRSLGEVPDIAHIEGIDLVVTVLVNGGDHHAAGIDVGPFSLSQM
jgi:hypothetical protein